MKSRSFSVSFLAVFFTAFVSVNAEESTPEWKSKEWAALVGKARTVFKAGNEKRLEELGVTGTAPLIGKTGGGDVFYGCFVMLKTEDHDLKNPALKGVKEFAQPVPLNRTKFEMPGTPEERRRAIQRALQAINAQPKIATGLQMTREGNVFTGWIVYYKPYPTEEMQKAGKPPTIDYIPLAEPVKLQEGGG